MPRTYRTRATGEIPHFAMLVARLTHLMARWGFRERKKNGSVSWISRAGGRYETVFKLIHVGGGGMLLGVNKATVAKNEKLRRIVWPAEFAVAPQDQVEFVGFRVANDEVSLQRAYEVLLAFGKPDAAQGSALDNEEAERSLDTQLKALSAEDDLVAGSVSAAVALLPAEDFSDWES